jgi:AcrR family transcriptional regulator
MGIAERKERQRAELREQILAAARRIVLDEGFDQLTMRKIADAIEYSPATIYLYFDNREAIGRQLCTESFEHLVSYMSRGAQVADPRARLRSIGRSYAQFGFDNPKEYRLLFMTHEAFMSELFPVFPEAHRSGKEPGQRAFQFVVDTVTEAQRGGLIAAGDPYKIAEMLWTSVHGVVSLALTCPEAFETAPDELIDGVCDTLLCGLSQHVTAEARATS